MKTPNPREPIPARRLNFRRTRSSAILWVLSSVLFAGGASASLDGVWRRSDGVVMEIIGTTGVFRAFSPFWQGFADEGLLRLGDAAFRNSSQTGANEWSYEHLWGLDSTPRELEWTEPGTLTLSGDGNTLSAESVNPFGGNKAVYIYERDPPQWDADHLDMGGGWRWLPWFGFYRPMGEDGWIWHTQHGFFFAPPDAAPDSIWLYSEDMGWLWTSNTVYPFLYRADDGAWLWYNGAVHPRWFRNMTADTWEYLP